ncbi:HIT domain [Oligella ureolytica]|uniref:HIT domain n=1 Tax=Oligella ureolytica TaxID=90244 RepID=A0A378XFQ1_9BURK|nr:HIT family protein [Oligella ureolytica]QPT39277.1 HIT family protein [Oligella ureolytica]SUA55495.1 HIT domain [Oligella ureolytica]SUA56768.1 HIT domain [Oligella ureolytica]
MSEQHCVLCNEVGGRLLWQNDLVRIINANDTYYPAFTRVIYQSHIKEMSELSPTQRHELMDFVYLVEEVQREVLEPAKINLAQFGTMVPHMHWHIIPRFKDDPHYPDAIWSTAKYELSHHAISDYLNKQKNLLARYESVLVDRLKSVY